MRPMILRWQILTIILPLLVYSAACAREPALGSLVDYVAKKDTSFTWKKRREGTVAAAKYIELTLTSQTWQDTTWRHQLFIIKPASCKDDSRQALLFIAGGSWKDEYAEPATSDKLPKEASLFAVMAEQLATPIAVLMHCPFQPIFEGRHEDAAIAFTFEKYLKTGDGEWPLLLPMVKTAVRAMDATQAVVKQEWGMEIANFTISGASKRGWTTWLTSAVDPRVNALAPMVIDVLQIDKQMEHQKATWGELSHQINDYKELRLDQHLNTQRGQALLEIVDPFRYRKQLTQPKLVILGTNDQYWPLDACNLYWKELHGDKYILYCPNNGHGLNDYRRIFSSINALHQQTISGKRLPKMNWTFRKNDKAELVLAASSDLTPSKVLTWTATAAKRDFRESTWTSTATSLEGSQAVASLPLPKEGSAAMYCEFVYDEGTPGEYSFCTNLQIVPDMKPAP